MTLDEAIIHCEEVIAENEKICRVIPEHSASAYHCAEEHRQLAEWLKELKTYRENKLTDKEQRIFLAGMDREREVCKKVDEGVYREPYEDSLVWVCREIERKVKKALF